MELQTLGKSLLISSLNRMELQTLERSLLINSLNRMELQTLEKWVALDQAMASLWFETEATE